MREVVLDFLGVLWLFLLVTALPLSWVGWSWLEASSYQRVTGVTVTTWDAMFLSLRVDGCPEWRRD